MVTRATVRRGLRELRDTLLCPAHDPTRHTFSGCVLYFYNVLQQLGYPGVVVWDWNDVPQRPLMHWDATLFREGMPHRVEIDGPIHDLKNDMRMHGDIVKDDLVVATPGLSLLRLKHQDSATWALALHAYMDGRVHSELDDVWATEWYRGFEYPGWGPMFGCVKII